MDETTQDLLDTLRSQVGGYSCATGHGLKTVRNICDELEATIKMLSETILNITIAVTDQDDWKGSVADAVTAINARFAEINEARQSELKALIEHGGEIVAKGD